MPKYTPLVFGRDSDEVENLRNCKLVARSAEYNQQPESDSHGATIASWLPMAVAWNVTAVVEVRAGGRNTCF